MADKDPRQQEQQKNSGSEKYDKKTKTENKGNNFEKPEKPHDK